MFLNKQKTKHCYFYSHKIFKHLFISFLILFTVTVKANIPFRVSIKFFVDAGGARPTAGDFISNADVDDQEQLGNDILKTEKSELRILVTEIIDLPTSLSSFSDDPVNSTTLANIRRLALLSPTLFRWRSNAINVYVTGGTGSAIAYLPDRNDTVLMGQAIRNTTLLHELGHSYNVKHTHDPDGDGCSDTLGDNSDWTSINQMANNSYGVNYSELSSSQKSLVDRTWYHVLSYHAGENRSRFSPCQKDRMSSRTSPDAHYLTKTPRYVHPTNSVICSYGVPLACNGWFILPYPDLQSALDAGNLAGKAIVLERGSHSITQTNGINSNVDIYSRQGTASIDREKVLYELPWRLDQSKNPAVSEAAKNAKREAKLARKVLKDAEDDLAATSANEKKLLKKQAKEKSKQHKSNVMEYLLEAEKYAAEREKHAIQMELAKRYRQSQNYKLCSEYYNRVAEDTEQINLKEIALARARKCLGKLEKSSIVEPEL